MTSSYRPIDSKREEFRKYLERAGVMDALTKALVCLYEESDKPTDALDYVRKQLGDSRPDEAEYTRLKNDLESALNKIRELEDENARLNKLLSTGGGVPDEEVEVVPVVEEAPEVTAEEPIQEPPPENEPVTEAEAEPPAPELENPVEEIPEDAEPKPTEEETVNPDDEA